MQGEVKKVGISIVYVVLIAVIYHYSEEILGFIGGTEQIWVLAIAASLMSLFPAIPYPIVGGVLGAALGPAVGAIITWVGSSVASVVMFLFVRLVYREWGHKLLHGHPAMDKLATLFEKNAFLAILFTRMIPFVPSIAINVYAALSKVPFGIYTVASLAGKLPAMLLFAMVGNDLAGNPRNLLLTLTVYACFMLVAWLGYRSWLRRV